MKKTILVLSALALILSGISANAQNYNFGLWEYFGGPYSPEQYPIKGRLTNFAWKDIEPSNNSFNWTDFDATLKSRTADGLPTIFMVFTKEDAPDWIYENGVPKVIEKDGQGQMSGHSPYYADSDYKFFFKRMITKVREHVETLPADIRANIIGVQACLGSTGDYISYKGEVDSEYYLSAYDFFELFKEFSLHFYNEYKNTSPAITLLSNPKNDGADQNSWVIENCPGWIKCGTIGKGYQLNDEKSKSTWLYNTLNKPVNGSYIRARSEMSQQQSANAGWWNENKYGNQFANACYSIYWGLDWSNQGLNDFKDQNSDSIFKFFNKYAGQKDPIQSTNAMCALKDVLDAADGDRFPASIYGTVDRNNIKRYQDIVSKYAAYGAKLGDKSTVNLLELDNLSAQSINDVGWDLLPGNYERFLYQINANETSVGYWNIKAAGDPNSMYGRFGRGFDVKSGKTALYFDLDDAFLRYQPLNGAYPISIDITYLDKGTGSFGLYYDAKSGNNKLAAQVTCKNSNKWKTISILINDAYFGNRGTNGSDFAIQSINNEDVIFSLVEFARPKSDLSDVGLIASPLAAFDTICYNGESAANSFVLSGHYLDGTRVTVGPFRNYKFSVSANGTYTDSVIFEEYGTTINSTIFVKFNPDGKEVISKGSIPVRGSGFTLLVPVSATSVNSLPAIKESVIDISCYNQNDGKINLDLTGGSGPFTYSWSSSDYKSFGSSTKDVSGLKAGQYALTLTAAFNCSYNASYVIQNPGKLGIGFSQDSAIFCKGGSTTVQVFATGGTAPFSGTGTFTAGPGNKSYTITDARGCTVSKGYNVANGSNTAPARPNSITSISATDLGLCNGGQYDFSTVAVKSATSYSWTLPSGAKISSSNNEGLSIIANLLSTKTDQSISVSAVNACGSSAVYNKIFRYLPSKPAGVSGPTNVKENQTATYSIPATAGLTYLWTVPGKTEIVSGQNTNTISVKWGNRAGRITVKASNNCGLSAPSTLDVTMAGSFNMAEPESDQAMMKVTTESKPEIRIIPNPAIERFVVTMNGTGNIDLIQIFDVNGKTVFSRKSSQKTIAIERSEIKTANGIYFIVITSDNQKYNQKLILQ